jgi:glycosyltransferase involved in cell wall biosynthesis
LRQTRSDLELLVIDDGSTDGSSAFLAAVRDPRVRVVRHEANQGLTVSLRHGVELARGQYVARLDAVDVALPDRLERQVAFLEARPEVALLGGACVQTDEAGRFLRVWRLPETDLEIRWVSLLANPFVHSTVMIRRSVLLAHGLNYDPAFPTAQDFDLWSRLLERGRGANLGEPLIRYRFRGGVTRKRRPQQLALAAAVALRNLRRELPGFALGAEELAALSRTVFPPGTPEPAPEDWGRQLVRYRDLFVAFGARHGDHPDWPAVRRNFGVMSLGSAWQQRPAAGSVRAVASLLVRDPGSGLRLAWRRLGGWSDRRRYARGC